MKPIDREAVLSVLRAHEAELRLRGVESLSLFGSVARRREQYPQDVDVAIRVGQGFSEGGLDHFYQLEQLERHLRRLLRCEVDVVPEPVHKKEFQNAIDKDREIVF